MEDPKQQLVEKLQSAENVLVTVSRNPSVDQLASCLALALFLNKQNKHTAAVFSGNVPSTLEFLQPEETLEKTTDSLRDFIIALDKSKADKLRYKVEDNVVRIFITPYRASISEDDLEFSQGDFNVDLVIALGVGQQEDLDEAITVHGRILHDATVATINNGGEAGLGAINWNDETASSLSELVTDLIQALDPQLLDNQIATALLTGIVSATSRFSNEKTSPQAMSASALLMNAGANQQLVASKLEEPEQAPEPIVEAADESQPADGTLEIDHSDEPQTPPPAPPVDEEAETEEVEETAEPLADETDEVESPEQAVEPEEAEPVAELPDISGVSEGPKLITEPPVLGSPLTANSQQEQLDPVTDPLSLPAVDTPQMLDRKPEARSNYSPPPEGWAPPAPASQPAPTPTDSTKTKEPTLSDIEENVKKEEGQKPAEPDVQVKDVREEVSEALANGPEPPEPIQALNAQPLGEELHPESDAPSLEEQIPGLNDDDEKEKPSSDKSSGAPPPVPPPLTPYQFGKQPKDNS